MKIAQSFSRLGTESAFEVLAKAKKLESEGQKIINLGIGQPDFRTPQHIVEAGKKAAGRVLEIKNNILELLGNSNEYLSIEDISEKLSLSGQEILIYQILRHYAANHSLIIQGSIAEPTMLEVKLGT